MRVQSLLKGDYDLQNLASATVLVTGYYSLCRSNIDIYLGIIGDMKNQIRKYRKNLSLLEREKHEPETLEEIAEELASVSTLVRVEDESNQILIHEIDMAKRALQALYYISSLS